MVNVWSHPFLATFQELPSLTPLPFQSKTERETEVDEADLFLLRPFYLEADFCCDEIQTPLTLFFRYRDFNRVKSQTVRFKGVGAACARADVSKRLRTG